MRSNRQNPRSALGNQSFVIYISGALVALHGLWIYRVALAWYAWQLTESEFWVGMVAFTQFAPAVVLGPLFGVFADRFERRRASMMINAGCMINIGILSALTFSGRVDIAMLTAFSLMQGILDGAHTPVRMTLVPSIVTREQLQSAIATNSILFNVSRFIGPALSGFVIAKWSVAHAFGISALSYLALVAAVALVRLRPDARRPQITGNVGSELLAGIRYVREHKRIRALLISIAVASIFGRGVLEMLPAFADEVFAGGPSALAILTSAIGIGSVATGLVLAAGTRWLQPRAIRNCVMIAGGLIVVFSLVDTFWIAVVIAVVMGIILSLVGVGSQILIQTMVDDELRGRVTSLWGMIAFGGTAVGSLLIGSAASVYGLQESTVVAGLLCALLLVFVRGRPEPAVH